jgi:two-component sensor histidine kinase
MAIVHEKLYSSTDLAYIDFSDYTRTLATNLVAVYNTNPQRIRLVIDVKDVSLDVNRAIPVGLILNELVSNAFPDGRSGEITITGRRTPIGITLSVQDNGVGLPEGMNWRYVPTLGLHLVSTLIQQVQGSIELNRTGGTAFEMFIPSEKKETS